MLPLRLATCGDLQTWRITRLTSKHTGPRASSFCPATMGCGFSDVRFTWIICRPHRKADQPAGVSSRALCSRAVIRSSVIHLKRLSETTGLRKLSRTRLPSVVVDVEALVGVDVHLGGFDKRGASSAARPRSRTLTNSTHAPPPPPCHHPPDLSPPRRIPRRSPKSAGRP